MSFKRIFKFLFRNTKRFLPVALGLYFVPTLTVIFFILGLIDVSRNRPITFELLKKYFFGNGVLTWVISPFNLLIDLISFPFRNRGVYELDDFPEEHRSEIVEMLEVFKRKPELLDEHT